MLGLNGPRICRPHETAHVVRHRRRTALVNRPKHPQHIVGSDIARQAIATDGVRYLAEAVFHLGPRWLASAPQVIDVSLEQIRDCAGPGISRHLDTTALLDHFSKVTLEYFARLREGHRRI